MTKYTKGILITVAGAACWGISGTCTQYLCFVQGVNSVWLTQIRLIFAGLILICLGFLTERKKFHEFTHTPRDFCYCIAFGMIFIVLVGTVCSFVLFLMGTTYIGPARGNMVGCVEPLAATLTSAAVLKTVFMPMDILGFVLILATVFILAKK